MIFTSEKRLLERILEVLERIDRKLPDRFAIRITQENSTMAIGALVSPGTAVLLLALLDNGAPYVPPAGSSYAFAPSLTADDTNVSIVADPTTPEEFDVTIPAGDTNTSVTFTATATAPDGTTATGTLTIPLAPEPQQFTISITQTA
jgi:hypothetical protein